MGKYYCPQIRDAKSQNKEINRILKTNVSKLLKNIMGSLRIKLNNLATLHIFKNNCYIPHLIHLNNLFLE